MEDRLRIFQGVTGQAGQPGAFAAGLRALGYSAKAVSIEEHKFGYKSDVPINVPTYHLAGIFGAIGDLVHEFDVFHFHARSFASIWPSQGYPSLIDLLMLKAEGKKVFFHFRGSEIRLASEFREKNPFHYVDDPVAGVLFDKMPDAAKRRSLDFIRAVADGIFVTDPELQTYVPEATIVPRVLHEDDWPFIGIRKKRVPIVVHAPSRRAVKGTESLIRAVDRLRSRGVQIDFRLVEGLSHQEASRIYQEADIVVDQLRIGWYGVLATEAMALGKPVIAYIRDDIWKTCGHELPVLNANPTNIESVLEGAVSDWGLLQEASLKARDYFLKTHGSSAVCTKLAAIYETTPKKKINWVAVGEFLDSQKLKVSSARPKRSHAMRIIRYVNIENFRRLRDVARNRGSMSALKMVADKVLQR
ncbi:glycosyltransferase involved in cell wall biosynthesis [Pseudaminobacter salicylatoxidans]|uniref:Glycosyltransferase involved in cell wall biosynthesis n=1 Tax=Pseudaminobacter salicylatoxidans TaxID=93369 RepID=A0A316CPY6_PSESE|nr:glycosyltransferase [Pseudaminobacter salicylatoxidans]PWJ84244.1 glycosyltransferase involved in cell wall biosynthesis [Pseudaminobacter salicylatoxidans]